METQARKKSPRAPFVSLDEALGRALLAYEKERLHAAPADVVAQNIGYKSANSGTALQTLASMRYYGLLDRPKEGALAVTRAVESYRFAPDERLKKALLSQFVRNPPLFADLLEKYGTELPSDANLKHELITQRGFTPGAADIVLSAFRKSVAFAGILEREEPSLEHQSAGLEQELGVPALEPVSSIPSPVNDQQGKVPPFPATGADYDNIPVRLKGNRRAYLVVPMPFYEDDKQRLKAQIDLLLTDDD